MMEQQAEEQRRLQQMVGGHANEVLSRWIDEIVRQTWQLRGQNKKVEQLRERCSAVLEALALALDGAPLSQLGAPEWREALHLWSFTAGWMAGQKMPITAAVALGVGLRNVLRSSAGSVFDELVAMGTEAYVASVQQQAQARHRTIIEKSQVVCLLDESLPAMFLVGDPDRQALDEAIGRLMMLAVMRQATDIIVDVSSLTSVDEVLPEALRILADHRSKPPPRVVLTSVPGALSVKLRDNTEQPAGLVSYEGVEQALKVLRAEGR